MVQHLRIGQVATMTGLSVKAIRYYEAVGVLPAPPRSEGRYRLYDKQDIRRLGLLKLARQLGFTLREAGGLLDLADLDCCATVKPGLRVLLDEKLRQIDVLVRDLQTLRGRLADYAGRLPGRITEDACAPGSCVPAVEAPIALLVERTSGNGRLSRARGNVGLQRE